MNDEWMGGGMSGMGISEVRGGMNEIRGGDRRVSGRRVERMAEGE